ncbi:copper amine oxidase N-terminal domain-containing protein [Ruminiclostridium herbifermentans]|uniref:Copper amine oxidase N-terminal domain-containing protein n=1 Tax=Ruminiclostridium herbifermentans TaxID=2488810 RepID=A0A4U7JCS5_9FIRM|nr:copper amine oxidase N-terminal domain-containing protein [Ruminiclostridium herbifermentans]QNU67824.1 copper amine oxidase N-terminal domain-containing protein [Ruminiclostridium herbifermentans]
MKIVISYIITLAMILSMSLTIGVSTSEAANNITITVIVNGSKIKFPDTQPCLDGNNRVQVPVRFVSEALGASVSWVGSNKSVVVVKGKDKVTLYADKKNYTVNGVNKTMDTIATNKNGRILVPIRFVSEALGAVVTWDGTTHTVNITIKEDQNFGDELGTNPNPDRAITLEEKKRLDAYALNIGDNSGLGFTKTNQEFIEEMNKLDSSRITDYIEFATGAIDAFWNVDYTRGEKVFKDALRPYSSSELALDRWWEDYDNDKVIVKGKFYTDTSMIYEDASGSVRVRGIIRCYLTSCSDIESGFGKGAKLNTWLEMDIDVKIGYLGGSKYFYQKVIPLSDNRYI